MLKLLTALMLFLATGFGEVPIQKDACIVVTAKNRAVVKIRGLILSGGHDLILRPEQCPENRVILVYGDDPSLAEDKLKMKRNESFLRFEQFLREQQPAKPNEYCQSCPKYQVTADFTGRLDITASAGLKRDPLTGKAIGIEGFGDPLPYSRFRLLVTEVSNVVAKEIGSP